MPEQHQDHPPSPTIHVTVEAQRQNSLRRTALALVAAGGLLMGVVAAVEKFGPGDILPNWFKGWRTPAGLENKPPEATSGIVEGTEVVEEEFEMKCFARISVGVGVEGKQDAAVGGSRLNKIKFGDYIGCGNNETIRNYAKVHKSTVTGTVTSVTYEGPGLVVTQPRIDETDFRNCVDLRHDDSKEEIDKKVAKWKAKQASGKTPKCDDGFSYSEVVITKDIGDLANVVQTASTATQIAIAADAQVANAANHLNKKYEEEVRSYWQKKYPDVPVDVKLSNKDTAELQLQGVIKELAINHYNVEPITNTKGEIVAMKVSAPGGGSVTVKTRSVEVEELDIKAISESKPETSNNGDRNGRG